MKNHHPTQIIYEVDYKLRISATHRVIHHGINIITVP